MVLSCLPTSPLATVITVGRICLDILKDAWSPALQIRAVLLSIQALLSSPNPTDPLNSEAASLMLANKAAAEDRAREYTRKYAVPEGSSNATDATEVVDV